ncbi:MAG TPA: hypothetical protein VLC93_08030, partial [Myxococcota bacterium]|nr:hypothetical protein [Myxococcota bacterium]
TDSIRLPVDPGTHLILLEVDRPVAPTIVQYAGGQGPGIGRDDALVDGNRMNQSKKFNLTGRIANYTILGRDAVLSQNIAAIGAHIAVEATDRKTTMLGPGHVVALKCQANLEVTSTLRQQEVLTTEKLEERKILEFDYCEMAIPKTNATETDFRNLIAAAQQTPVDLAKYENKGMFAGYAFPLPKSREGAPSYEGSSTTQRLPADNSTHLLWLEVGSAPVVDVKSNRYSNTTGTTFGISGAYTYGSVSTYSSGGDKPKTMIVGRVLGYETVGGVQELVVRHTSVGEQIVIEATDRKTSALMAGDRILLRCNGDTSVLSAVRDNETLTPEKLQQRRIGELDNCEVATPTISATQGDFDAAAGRAPNRS